MEEIKEDYNLVTETYDDLDRLIYKNYYRSVVPYIKPGFNYAYGVINKKPKKLLYQDVYIYEGQKRIQSHIKRVYQPIIDFVSFVRVGSTNAVTATANFTCRSIIQASGFIWDANQNKLMNIAFMPPDFLKGGISSNTTSFIAYKEQNVTTGQKVHTVSSSGEIFFKAFAQVETGVLFSKTLRVAAL